eukprot:CAMPEP_0184483038 /NCGR_PEP_ID=MMETSP0113_2-20130426/4650_1 /TAXON_ID=91329 /ORGANISM="Norrisiella sphaerica, Strain BC52" /LENGTH=413 /DNA_ID=CAMNT_0026863167 /DNA_START=216 /DNA_END=1457 /DNA_ORIENTATION=-
MVDELHAEIHRHGIVKSDGEEGVFDSIEPVCLGVVQNYTLKEVDQLERLEHTPRSLDNMDGSQDLRMLLRLKELCLHYADTVTVELSEIMYRVIQREESAVIAKEKFCWDRREGSCFKFQRPKGNAPGPSSVSKPRTLVRKENQKRKKVDANSGASDRRIGRKKKEEADRKVDSAEQSHAGNKMDEDIQEAFQKMMQNPATQEMLRQEYEDPTMGLPKKDRKQIQRGVKALKCEICYESVKALIKEVHAMKKGTREFQDESKLLLWAESICDVRREPEGFLEESIHEYAPPPPEPAPWMDYLTVFKKKKKWQLDSLRQPVEKRGSGLSLKIQREGHILREGCQLSVGNNADIVAGSLFSYFKETGNAGECQVLYGEHTKCNALEILPREVCVEIYPGCAKKLHKAPMRLKTEL